MKRLYLSLSILMSLSLNLFFNNCSISRLNAKIKTNEADTITNTQSTQSSYQFNLNCIPREENTSVAQKITDPIMLNFKTTEDFLSHGIKLNSELSITTDLVCLKNSTKNNLTSIFIKMLLNENKNLLQNIDGLQNTATFLIHNKSFITSNEVLNNINDSCLISLFPNTHLTFASVTDPKYSEQKNLLEINHEVVYDRVFNLNNGINQNVTVAILDSGIDTTHNDLKSNLIFNDNKVLGYNALNNTGFVTDTFYHGTHVAGIIGAASNNNIGISGVMGKNIKLIPVKVSDDSETVDSAILSNGIRWATDQGVDVINISLSGVTESPDLEASIRYAVSKNVFVVIAAGNNGKELGKNIQSFPAQYGISIDGAITVGAIDTLTNTKTLYSNFSSEFVEIMAPGASGIDGVISTFPTTIIQNGYSSQFDGKLIEGTSISAPIVSGAAAMIIALAKSRGFKPSPSQIEAIIKKGAPSSGLLLDYVQNSRYVDLDLIISAADIEMGIDSKTHASRTTGQGHVKILNQPQPQNVIIGQNLNLSVDSTSDSSIFINYQWYKNGLLIANANQSQLSIKNTTDKSGGIYSVELSVGNTVVKSLDVEVFTAPTYCN